MHDAPAEDAEHKIHDEERSDDDETDEVNPRPGDSHRVVDLCTATTDHPPVFENYKYFSFFSDFKTFFEMTCQKVVKISKSLVINPSK